MEIICSDLEGVFVPEIWVQVAQKTGIEDLNLTTRDIADYDVLMKKRLSILDANNLKLKDITDVIATIDPLPGAVDFVDWLRSVAPLVIVSDTFVQFAGPLMEKLGRPTLLCHRLEVEPNGQISGYHLRQPDAKRKVVLGFKMMDYKVVAFGDSYNDTAMLTEADTGFLFSPPASVVAAFPQLPVAENYDTLKALIEPELS